MKYSLKETKLINSILRAIKENRDEYELDEDMARLAGSGGSLQITEEGIQALKDLAAKNYANIPNGFTQKTGAALSWLYKQNKDPNKRVQAVDYARELGVQQPYVNGAFKFLIEAGFVEKKAYELGSLGGGKGSAPSAGGKDKFGDMFSDLEFD